MNTMPLPLDDLQRSAADAPTPPALPRAGFSQSAWTSGPRKGLRLVVNQRSVPAASPSTATPVDAAKAYAPGAAGRRHLAHALPPESHGPAAQSTQRPAPQRLEPLAFALVLLVSVAALAVALKA